MTVLELPRYPPDGTLERAYHDVLPPPQVRGTTGRRVPRTARPEIGPKVRLRSARPARARWGS